ncbi:MAG TPA: hypothetical protein PLA03_11810 [Acidobacteriota bacterium]|nr:hypothetical protein [Acidobacteriota bacterium]
MGSDSISKMPTCCIYLAKRGFSYPEYPDNCVEQAKTFESDFDRHIKKALEDGKEKP